MEKEKVTAEVIFKKLMFIAFDAARVGIEDKQRLNCVRDHIGDFFRFQVEIYNAPQDAWWRKKGQLRLDMLKIPPTVEWLELCGLYEYLFTKVKLPCEGFGSRLDAMAQYIFENTTKRKYFVEAILTKARDILKQSKPEIIPLVIAS